MTPLHLDHVAHGCCDVAATHRFYGDLLGLFLAQAVRFGDALLFSYALADGTQLTFQTAAVAPPVRPPTDPRHIGLTVDSPAALAAWKARLTAHAIPFTIEDAGDDERIYFSDPNGVLLELEIRHPGIPPASDPRACVEAWIATHRRGS